MAAETRTVLVKPGDVLLIGNVGQVESPEQVEPVVRWLADVGVTAILFSGDIVIDAAHRVAGCASCHEPGVRHGDR